MSDCQLVLSGAAERDLDEAFRYLAGEAGTELALRFDRAVERALHRVCQYPQIGPAIEDPPG